MVGAPLATRMRPRTLEEVVGQRHLIGPGRPLTTLVASGEGVEFTARSVGTMPDGVVVAEFEIEWSFKRRK